MVPLTQNSLLKLPGASSRLESLALLPPYRALIALGLSFTVLTGLFFATEQWLALATAETIHQVGIVYTPPITAGFKAKGKIAHLLIDEADSLRSGPQTPDHHRFDAQNLEITQPWVVAGEGPNSTEEKATLSTEMTALLNTESSLATLNDVQVSRPVEDDFQKLIDGDGGSLLDSSDHLEAQRAQDLHRIENQNDLDSMYYAFLGIFYLGEALLLITSILLALWFRRILNPGVVAAFGIMLLGGGLLQAQLGTSLANLEKMEEGFYSIYNLGKLQSQVAETDLYLHAWFLSHDATDWKRLHDSTAEIYKVNNVLSDGSENLDPPFSADEITQLRDQGTGSGSLANEWRTSQSDANLLSAYGDVLKNLDQVRINETQGKHAQSLELLLGPNGLDDSFEALDLTITGAQSQKQAVFEIDQIKALSSLDLTSRITLFTALGQLIAFWLGLIPRLREYMR